MKSALIALVFLHGMIHLFGFAKAFGLAEFDRIQQNISKFHGVLWFVAFLLFALSGEALITNNPYWHWFAMAAIVISTVLIITVWDEAKYGIVPNIIVAVVAIAAFSSDKFEKELMSEMGEMVRDNNSHEIRTSRRECLKDLPLPVLKWLKSSGASDKEVIHSVWLRQRIKMKLTPAQKGWYDARAVQFFTIDSPAFLWGVRMEIPPFFGITGRDRCIDGKGEMRIKLFSLFNVVNERGKRIDEAVMQRFLAEIAWFPSAAVSPYITWESIDSLSARATITRNGTSGSGIFYFNPRGDFVEFRCFRYKDNGPEAKRYEWVVSVKEHSIIEGLKIPTKLEVSWMLESGKWTWLALEIVDVRYDDPEMISGILNKNPGLHKINSLF